MAKQEKIVTEAMARVAEWLGDPKETKKHPTVTLYTDSTARVVAVADLRIAMSTAQEPALDDDAELRDALDSLKFGMDFAYQQGLHEFGYDPVKVVANRLQAKAPETLWLWRNFVGGKPEYWAFDNPFPCESAGGDPLTLGDPCGWVIFKRSVNGRPEVPASAVMAAMKQVAPETGEG